MAIDSLVQPVVSELAADADTNPNPYVFFVGCIRSGTTLLQRLVDAHPAIAVIHETHWIPRVYKTPGCLGPGRTVTPELVRQLCSNARFSHLGLSADQVAALAPPGDQVPFTTFVSRIFDLFAASKGKRLAGDKTPAYVKDLRFLHKRWPSARFVHLIRDGRDVALSIVNWSKACNNAGSFATWSADPVTTTALYWRRKVLFGLQRRELLGPDLLYEIRYESLVQDPAAECRTLCAFLDLPYDGAMLRFYEGRMRTKPGLDAKHSWRPVTPGLRDWRTQMAPEDVERFEAAAGDLLEELGYERAFPVPGAQARDRAGHIRDAFTRELEARNERIPERW